MKIELELEPEQISECTTLLDQILEMKPIELLNMFDITDNHISSLSQLFTQLLKVELK